jgi:hypothetical protein
VAAEVLELPATIRAVTSLNTTELGAAKPCGRAARFGVSPTTLTSRARLSPMTSPTTTSPVAMPVRVANAWPSTRKICVTCCADIMTP